MNYKIADFVIKVTGLKYPRFDMWANKYKTEEKEEVEFNITPEDVAFERSVAQEADDDSLYEITAVLRKFSEWVAQKGAFLFHSVCFDLDGVGFVFAAHSGTGKTTHMIRWKNYFGDRLKTVNGDKPIIRFLEDEPNIPYAYGNPWNGKERFDRNMRTPVKHICFLKRSKKNYAEKVSKSEIIDLIFNQFYIPQNNPMATLQTIQLIDRFATCCDLWIIHCNMDDNAGELVYKSMFEYEVFE